MWDFFILSIGEKLNSTPISFDFTCIYQCPIHPNHLMDFKKTKAKDRIKKSKHLVVRIDFKESPSLESFHKISHRSSRFRRNHFLKMDVGVQRRGQVGFFVLTLG